MGIHTIMYATTSFWISFQRRTKRKCRPLTFMLPTCERAITEKESTSANQGIHVHSFSSLYELERNNKNEFKNDHSLIPTETTHFLPKDLSHPYLSIYSKYATAASAKTGHGRTYKIISKEPHLCPNKQ